MNRGCSASKACASCSGEAAATVSCHHRSRPSVHSTSMPVPVDHQHVLDGVGAGDGFVDRCLDGCCGAASPLAVDGDDELGLGVVDARA